MNIKLIPLKRESFLISRFIHSVFFEYFGRVIYDGIWVGKDSNIPNIDGHFRRKAEQDERFLGLTYKRIHQKTQRWLEVILRLIYNSGGALPAHPDACT